MYASSGMVIFEDLVTFEDNMATVRPPGTYMHIDASARFQRQRNPPTVANALVLHVRYMAGQSWQISGRRSLVVESSKCMVDNGRASIEHTLSRKHRT